MKIKLQWRLDKEYPRATVEISDEMLRGGKAVIELDWDPREPESGKTGVFVNKDEAQQIVDHLTRVFALEPQAPITPLASPKGKRA